MKLHKAIIITAVIILSAFPSFSQDDETGEEDVEIKAGGYYINLFMFQDRDSFYSRDGSAPEKKKVVSDLNRLRLSYEMNYHDTFTFRSDLDFEGVSTSCYGTDEFDRSWRENDYNDIVKMSHDLSDNRVLYSKVEFQNLYAKMTAGSFTGTAGRQQIRFGSSRLWNPLDLMNPLSPLAVEGADEQKGADALRLDWYLGESTEVTGAAAPKKEEDCYNKTGPKSSNYIVRFKTGTKEFDYAFLYGYTAKRVNAGADFVIELYDGLFTGGFLFSDPGKGEAYYQCGTGYEYTFGSGVYILVEYFYNSLPVNDDVKLQAALFHFSSHGIDESNYYILSNRIITYNSHYMSILAGYDFHPLLRGEVFSIYDFQGGGVFINASLRLNAMENLDLNAGVSTSFIDQKDRASDFKVYDKEPVYYASLQYYF